MEASFKVEYDVNGRAQCMQYKKKMNKTELRMGKLIGIFFDKSRKGMIYHYFHPNCLILPHNTLEGSCGILNQNQNLTFEKMSDYES